VEVVEVQKVLALVGLPAAAAAAAGLQVLLHLQVLLLRLLHAALVSLWHACLPDQAPLPLRLAGAQAASGAPRH
jgi:hypothetical protein